MKRLAGPLVVIALTAAWFVTLRPAPLGGPAAFVVVSGHSMEPALTPGTLVVARRKGAYDVGDVIVYRVPKGENGAGTRVIHRVTGGSATEGYTTQGDNREHPDLWRPRAQDVEGKKLVAVPGAGRAMLFIGTPLALGGMLGLLVFLSAGEQMLPRRLRRTSEAGTPIVSPVFVPREVVAQGGGVAAGVAMAAAPQSEPAPVVASVPVVAPEPVVAPAPADVPPAPAVTVTPPVVRRPAAPTHHRRHRAVATGGMIVSGVAAAALVARGRRPA
jgi:signal peptidase